MIGDSVWTSIGSHNEVPNPNLVLVCLIPYEAAIIWNSRFLHHNFRGGSDFELELRVSLQLNHFHLSVGLTQEEEEKRYTVCFLFFCFFVFLKKQNK